MKKYNSIQKFPGFPPKPTTNFWSYPKDLNGYWHQLSGSEQKVLDYILRHTWGFDKTADEISLTQLEEGIENFDKGTGLSRPTVVSAIKGLIKKGFIKKAEGRKANLYELIKNFNYPSKKSLPLASKKSLPTIDKFTIEKEQYNSSFNKEENELIKTLVEWNNNQSSPTPDAKKLMENIVGKYGYEKVSEALKRHGQDMNNGYQNFCQHLKESCYCFNRQSNKRW